MTMYLQDTITAYARARPLRVTRDVYKRQVPSITIFAHMGSLNFNTKCYFQRSLAGFKTSTNVV